MNGIPVTRHLGGYDAFSADITPALRRTGQQEILIRVYSPVDSATIPVGKQRLNPGGIFYTASLGHLAVGVDRAGGLDQHQRAADHP